LQEALAGLGTEIVLLPNAVDVSAFKFRPRQPLAPRLVWLRAFHDCYRPELAPEVLAAVRLRTPTATLRMVGPDKRDGSLARTRAAVSRLGLEQAITIVTGVPKHEVPAELERGDIFLNTTDVDNVPISVMEAMAAGMCVVSTDAGGLPHLLDDGVDALLAPTGDAPALARAVQRLLDQPDLAARLTAAARAKVEARDWAPVVDRWRALFERVASRG
jgi:glycosyltransferase involved in cell wall biosynthesis